VHCSKSLCGKLPGYPMVHYCVERHPLLAEVLLLPASLQQLRGADQRHAGACVCVCVCVGGGLTICLVCLCSQALGCCACLLGEWEDR
jgi:hypothetical protein